LPLQTEKGTSALTLGERGLISLPNYDKEKTDFEYQQRYSVTDIIFIVITVSREGKHSCQNPNSSKLTCYAFRNCTDYFKHELFKMQTKMFKPQ